MPLHCFSSPFDVSLRHRIVTVQIALVKGQKQRGTAGTVQMLWKVNVIMILMTLLIYLVDQNLAWE